MLIFLIHLIYYIRWINDGVIPKIHFSKPLFWCLWLCIFELSMVIILEVLLIFNINLCLLNYFVDEQLIFCRKLSKFISWIILWYIQITLATYSCPIMRLQYWSVVQLCIPQYHIMWPLWWRWTRWHQFCHA